MRKINKIKIYRDEKLVGYLVNDAYTKARQAREYRQFKNRGKLIVAGLLFSSVIIVSLIALI